MVEHQSPYPAYKPSGVEWLGDVPAHWETRRLKSLACNVSQQTTDHPNGIGYIALEHVESWTGRIVNEGAEAGEGQLKRFESEDVLFGKLRPYLAKVVLAKSPGLCVGEFLVLRVRMGISPRFLEYVLRSKAAIDWINSSTFGARMPRTDWAFVGSMRFPLPPLPEQVAIARFLDQANSRIDRYIHAKEKLVALLEEQKRAVIRQAVAGQIDVRTGRPYPAYKDSDVEWLVKVPRHWAIRRLGTVARVFNGSTPSRSQPAYWEGGTVPWSNSSKLSDQVVVEPSEYVTPRALKECSIAVVPQGAVVVGLVGQGRTRGLAAVLGISTTISQNLAAIIPSGLLEGRFLWHVLSAQYRHLRELGRGGNQEALNCDLVGRLRVHIPPAVEQAAIIKYLDRSLTTLGAAQKRIEKQVALARDYRLRLVADVVTGKLDVREVSIRDV